MSDSRDPADLARTAADAIQQLNRITLSAKAYDTPGAVSEVADALAVLVERLPQALQQAEAGLAQLHDSNAIRLDNKPPAETSQKDIFDEVFTVTSALQQARERLEQARTELRRATGPLSHMGSVWPDED